MSGPSLQATQSNHVRYQGSYTFPTHAKFLGGAGENDLAAQQASWYQEAYAYYNAVAAGEIERPSEEQWNEFLNQMNWVYEQLNDSSSSDGFGGDPSVGMPWEGGEDSGPTVNQFGGVAGPNQNWVYDEMDSRIGFTGDPTPNNIWAYNNNLDVDSTSATVTAEITSDGLNPASNVLKVIVKGQRGESVYYYHNYTDPDFKLNINVPKTTQVSGAEILPDHIKVKKLDDQTGPGQDRPPASIEGEAQGDGTTYYEAAFIDQTIDFYPQGDETEVNYVVGNANISVPLSSTVSVKKSTVPGYDYAVMVTDKDGVVKTYHVKKEFKTNINAMKENVTFIIDETIEDEEGEAVAGSSSLIRGEVPEEYKDTFTLNGGGTEDSPAVEAQGDSNFTTDEDGNRTWDGSSFDIYTRKDGKTGKVYARNDVTLHASSNQEYWTVEWDAANSKYVVKVWDTMPEFDRDGTVSLSAEHLKETIEVDNLVDNLKLDIDPSHVFFLGGIMKDNDYHGLSGVEEAQKLSFSNTEGAGETAPGDERAADARSVAETLANLQGVYLSADEILDKAQTMGIDLNNLPSDPFDPKLIEFLVTVDEKFRSLIESYKNSDSETVAAPLRNRLKELFSLLYPDAGVDAGDDNDDLVFNGKNYDVLDQNSKHLVTIDDYSTYGNILWMSERDGGREYGLTGGM